MLEELRTRVLFKVDAMKRNLQIPITAVIDIPVFFNNISFLRIYREYSGSAILPASTQKVFYVPQMVNRITESINFPDPIKAQILDWLATFQEEAVVRPSDILKAIESALEVMPEYRPAPVDFISQANLEIEAKYALKEEEERTESSELILAYAAKLLVKNSRHMSLDELKLLRKEVTEHIGGYCGDVQKTIKEMICRLSDRPKEDADFADSNLVSDIKLTALAIKAAGEREVDNMSEEEIEELTRRLKSWLHPESIHK